MSRFDDISEASESSPSKATALANIREQVERGETMGVVAMYERAAYQAGATVAEVCEATRKQRPRIWRVCRGNGSIPTGPDHDSLEAAQTWAKSNVTGIYNVIGYY